MSAATATASQTNLFKAPDPDRIRNQGFLIKVFVKVRALTRNHKRRAFCSNAYLAEELGCSVATVTRALTRLAALGVIALEQVIGIKRYIRVKASLETLKALLFPGHETNWRESAPEVKPARRRTAKASSPPVEATPTPSFEHSIEEPAAHPVAEGQYRVSRRDTLQTLPTEEGQQQSRVSSSPGKEVAAAPSAELTEPLTEALGADGALPLAKLAASLKRTPGHVRQCVRAALAKDSIHNLGGYLRRLIEAPEGSVAPPAGAPTHASDRGEKSQRTITTPPEDLAKMRAADQAKKDRDAAFEAAWKALDDAAMKVRLEATREQLRAKGGFYRSKSDSPTYVQNTARSEFRAEWEAAHPLSASSFPAGHTSRL